jgi:hypothetical protein
LSLERERIAVGRAEEELVERLVGAQRRVREGDTYTVTVGDACYVAVGEITGRSYDAVRREQWGTVVNSPAATPELARFVRTLWPECDPAAELFRHLHDDLADRSDRRWSIRRGAIQRLATYYPDEAIPLLAQQIRARLEVPLPGPLEEPRESVSLPLLLEGLRFSDRPDVTAILREAILRNDDPLVLVAGMSAHLAATEPELVTALAWIALQREPVEPGPENLYPWLVHVDVLQRSLAVLPDPAPLLELALGSDSFGMRRAACRALTLTKRQIPRAVDLLLPLIGDETPHDEVRLVEQGFEASFHVRLCDSAAEALQRQLTGELLMLGGTLAERDARIRRLRTQALMLRR